MLFELRAKKDPCIAVLKLHTRVLHLVAYHISNILRNENIVSLMSTEEITAASAYLGAGLPGISLN